MSCQRNQELFKNRLGGLSVQSTSDNPMLGTGGPGQEGAGVGHLP